MKELTFLELSRAYISLYVSWMDMEYFHFNVLHKNFDPDI